MAAGLLISVFLPSDHSLLLISFLPKSTTTWLSLSVRNSSMGLKPLIMTYGSVQ